MSVGAAVLDDFKALVRQHGVSDVAIIMNRNKGDTLLTAPGLEMNCIHQCGTFLKHKDKCCRHE